MSEDQDNMFYCSFVSIHYIICECGETFPTEEALKLHLEREHPHKKERKEYKCGVCEATFSSEQLCIRHYESCHIDIKQEHDYEGSQRSNEHCTDSSSPEHRYVYEESEHGNRVICEVCGQLYYDTSTHTCPTDTDKKLVPYKIQRMKKKHQPKKVVCEVCGKNYASQAALRYHQRVHTGERPYKCTMCDRSFTMPLFLQIHTRTHTGERPFKCQFEGCSKAFSNKAAILRHDRVHTGIKPYECPQCGKAFTQSNSMKLHIHTVHLKLPTPYKSKARKDLAKMRELRAAAIRSLSPIEDMAAENIDDSNSLSHSQFRLVNSKFNLSNAKYRVKPQISASEPKFIIPKYRGSVTDPDLMDESKLSENGSKLSENELGVSEVNLSVSEVNLGESEVNLSEAEMQFVKQEVFVEHDGEELTYEIVYE